MLAKPAPSPAHEGRELVQQLGWGPAEHSSGRQETALEGLGTMRSGGLLCGLAEPGLGELGAARTALVLGQGEVPNVMEQWGLSLPAVSRAWP